MKKMVLFIALATLPFTANGAHEKADKALRFAVDSACTYLYTTASDLESPSGPDILWARHDSIARHAQFIPYFRPQDIKILLPIFESDLSPMGKKRAANKLAKYEASLTPPSESPTSSPANGSASAATNAAAGAAAVPKNTK